MQWLYQALSGIKQKYQYHLIVILGKLQNNSNSNMFLKEILPQSLKRTGWVLQKCDKSWEEIKNREDYKSDGWGQKNIYNFRV